MTKNLIFKIILWIFICFGMGFIDIFGEWDSLAAYTIGVMIGFIVWKSK